MFTTAGAVCGIDCKPKCVFEVPYAVGVGRSLSILVPHRVMHRTSTKYNTRGKYKVSIRIWLVWSMDVHLQYRLKSLSDVAWKLNAVR